MESYCLAFEWRAIQPCSLQGKNSLAGQEAWSLLRDLGPGILLWEFILYHREETLLCRQEGTTVSSGPSGAALSVSRTNATCDT